MRAGLLTRYDLEEVGGSGRMNVLLDHQGLNIGDVLTIEDVDGEWRICQVWETVRAESVKSYRAWSNNI